eukprot:3875481-Alexandrium_andersonii.AAC.1
MQLEALMPTGPPSRPDVLPQATLMMVQASASNEMSLLELMAEPMQLSSTPGGAHLKPWPVLEGL